VSRDLPHIRSAVRDVVLSRRGAQNAITGDDLAALVRVSLDLVHIAPQTMRRRCQEAIADLVAEGETIASTSASGYYVPITLEEIEAGARDLRHRLIGIARRLRSYDARTADAVLEALGQGRLAA
jgi:hypothetical protein